MIKQQNGVTLVELMISLVLGLGVVAGIGQLFIQSQKSFTLQRNVSDMTEDASFLLEVLAKGILQAGYDKDDTSGDRPDFAPDASVLSSTISFAQGEFIRGTDNELVYRYKLSDTDDLKNFLCTESLPAALNNIITVRIYKDDDSNSIPVFYCKVKYDSTTRNAEPLISQVQDIILKYGVRVKTYNSSVPPDPTPENDRYYYTTADNVTNWKDVFAVKIFVVLRSNEDKLTRAPVTYTVDGTPYTATDNRIYKVFSKTIFLRGLIQ